MGQENFSQLNASAEGAIRRLAKKGLIFSVVLTGATAVIENITHQTPSAAASSPSCDVHREVLGGDTLSAIARQYPDVTWQQIQAANNLTNPNFIRPGQNLIIPQLCSPVVEAIGGQELPPGSVVAAENLLANINPASDNARQQALQTMRQKMELGFKPQVIIPGSSKLTPVESFVGMNVVGIGDQQKLAPVFTYRDAKGTLQNGILGIERFNFITGSSLDHFEIGHGIDVTIENSWSPAEKAAIKQGILQSQKALGEFFGPPADNFLNFQIKKKNSVETAKLAEDTGMAFDIFPGWTQCGQGNCAVTLTRAPMGDPRDTTTLVHELANAWQGGTDGSLSPIFNYDRTTEPSAVVYELDSLFETDSLAFLADKFINNKLNGKPFKSIDRLEQSVVDADPQFLAKVRGELKKSSFDSQTKLTWQQATDLIEKASPPVGKILKSLKTASNK